MLYFSQFIKSMRFYYRAFCGIKLASEDGFTFGAHHQSKHSRVCFVLAMMHKL